MDSLFLGAYWGDRPEDLTECAERLRGFVSTIGNSSDLFKFWISPGKSPIRELGPQSSRDDVCALLGAGVHRKDFGGEVMPELGYIARLWNGMYRDDEAASLMVICGSAAGNPNLSNACVLEFPADLKFSENANMVRSVFDAAIHWWEPDWAWVGTDELRDAQNNDRPLIGLLSFFSYNHYSVDEAALSVAGAHVQQLQSGVLVWSDPHSVRDIVRPLKSVIRTM